MILQSELSSAGLLFCSLVVVGVAPLFLADWLGAGLLSYVGSVLVPICVVFPAG